jgi:hypothetical protein
VFPTEACLDRHECHRSAPRERDQGRALASPQRAISGRGRPHAQIVIGRLNHLARVFGRNRLEALGREGWAEKPPASKNFCEFGGAFGGDRKTLMGGSPLSATGATLQADRLPHGISRPFAHRRTCPPRCRLHAGIATRHPADERFAPGQPFEPSCLAAMKKESRSFWPPQSSREAW